MPEIKERPILFSAPMVRAIMEGQKTVTRREVKKRAALDCLAAGFEPAFLALPGNADLCPYGKPGDRLWVRETFNRTNPGGESGIYYYRADGKFPKCIGGGRFTSVESWKPSIHMPRAACRILLEITDVRVERLQDISEEQALAEGVRPYPEHAEFGDWYHVEGIETYSAEPSKSFELLWESINGAGSWAANPWVWVVEFKRVTP